MTNEEILCKSMRCSIEELMLERDGDPEAVDLILKAMQIARLEGQIEGIYCLDGDIPPSFLLKKYQQQIEKLFSE